MNLICRKCKKEIPPGVGCYNPPCGVMCCDCWESQTKSDKVAALQLGLAIMAVKEAKKQLKNVKQ